MYTVLTCLYNHVASTRLVHVRMFYTHVPEGLNANNVFTHGRPQGGGKGALAPMGARRNFFRGGQNQTLKKIDRFSARRTKN